MKTFIQDGDRVTVTASRTAASGSGMLVGLLFGATISDAVSGSPCQIQTSGVVTLPKVTGTANNEGVRVFWDNSAFNVTTTTTSNNCIGWAVGPGNYASGATTINVLLGKPNATAA